MTPAETIERALRSGVLLPEMTHVPDAGASPNALASLEGLLARPLSLAHRELLARWNGINLDIIRIFGVGPESALPTVEEDLAMAAELGLTGAVPVANDYNGYVYFELPDGSIIRWDHDGENHAVVGTDLGDFIQNGLFGSRAGETFGREWLDELLAAGLVQAGA